jgi:hypothetical protein
MTETLASKMIDLPFTGMPKTLRDAVTVTLQLGLRYL